MTSKRKLEQESKSLFLSKEMNPHLNMIKSIPVRNAQHEREVHNGVQIHAEDTDGGNKHNTINRSNDNTGGTEKEVANADISDSTEDNSNISELPGDSR